MLSVTLFRTLGTEAESVTPLTSALARTSRIYACRFWDWIRAQGWACGSCRRAAVAVEAKAARSTVGPDTVGGALLTCTQVTTSAK